MYILSRGWMALSNFPADLEVEKTNVFSLLLSDSEKVVHKNY